MANAFKERIQHKLSNWLSRFAVYVARDKRVVLSDNAEQGKTYQIKVLARSEYEEQALDVPITSYVELVRFLKRKYPVSDGNLLVIGDKASNGQTGYAITRYHWRSPQAPEASLTTYVPEGLLYQTVLKNGEVASLSTPDGELFVGRVNNKVETSRRSPLLPKLERFAMAIGLAEEAKQHELSEQQTLAVIKERLPLVVLKQGWMLSQRKQTKKEPVRWAIPGAIAAGVVAIYLGASSLYLALAESYYQSAVADAQQPVNEVLNQQQTITRLNQRVEELNALQQEFSDPLTVWPIVFEVDETMDAYVDTIRWESEFTELSGATTAEASDILTTLIEDYNVEEAEFSGPVRRRGARQTYSIRMNVGSEASDE